MLDDNDVEQFSEASEVAVKKQFEKLGYEVKKLDHPKKTARPDFLISNSSGPQLLCEVKAIISFGYMADKNAHLSTRDKNLRDFHKEIDLRQMHDDIADAARKRSALIAGEPKYAKLPMLVAFVFDPLAEDLFLVYPRRFDENVSGILTIKRRDDSGEEELTDEELAQRARANPMSMFSWGRLEFVLVRNKNARIKVPKDFQLRCVTEGYDESD
jgi:hypothetical protein